MLSATIGGGFAGALAGGVGGVAGSVREPLSWLALGGLLVALVWDAAGLPVKLLQVDRETPKRWLDDGGISWAWRTGVLLGLGLTTRIGFVVWYAVPIVAFASASAWRGALVWASYGMARTASSSLLRNERLMRRWGSIHRISEELLRSRRRAGGMSRATGVVALAVAVVALA